MGSIAVNGGLRPTRYALPTLVIFLGLLAWSAYAYLTVRVNADILAEAIQVQRWIQDPFWVWSYPGQLHGGVIEYPLIALAEVLSPGNVYALTLPRVLYIPITGILLASSFRLAAPHRSLWPFAVAACLGPTVLHGFRMISDIYPSSWLLSAVGIWVVFRWAADRVQSSGWLFLGGLLIGLGAYQHASSAVFSLPMLVFAATHWRVKFQDVAIVGLGGLVGCIPLALALFTQPEMDVVYRPVRSGAPNLLGALGLSFDDLGWRSAMLPNGLGIAHADSTFLDLGWAAQWWINVIGLALILLVIATALVRGWNAFGFMWITALSVILALVLMVPPIWYYGTPIGFLIWFSVGFAPMVFSRAVALVTVLALFAISTGFSISQVWNSHPRFLTGIQVKAQQVEEVNSVAQAIRESGIRYVFGDYWEVLPIAYASSTGLTPITFNFNRFPVRPSDVGEEIVVAVTPGTIAVPFGRETWDLSAEARELANRACLKDEKLTTRLPRGVAAYRCPTSVLMERR